MDNELVLAVAGAGKTTKILNSLADDKRSLIITYTTENLRSLEKSLVKKYGAVPENITLKSYFSFLYSFCFRPFLSYKLRDNAFNWNLPPAANEGGKPMTDIRHYMSSGRYIYANRMTKLIDRQGFMPAVIARIEKYFDCLYIDEVQDFAANDFNFILELSKAEVQTLFVGDFYQHTFDTSRDGRTRENLHRKGIEYYTAQFGPHAFDVDSDSLSKTYRCSPTVCDFITNSIGIEIQSHRTDQTKLEVVTDRGRAKELFDSNEIVKLFFREHYRYGCFSNNWGKSKGLDHYQDVCVVLNPKTYEAFEKGRLRTLADSTRNKLYVACSRARGNLYLLDQRHLGDFKAT